MPNYNSVWEKLRALPQPSVGPCLTTEQAIAYVQETLPSAAEKQVESHLSFCKSCCREVEILFEAQAEWNQDLATRGAEIAELEPISGAERTSVFSPQRIPWLALGIAAKTQSPVKWKREVDAGQWETVTLSPTENGLLFTLDTQQQNRGGSLVRLALLDSNERERLHSWCVLHADPWNVGHFVAAVRIPQSIASDDNPYNPDVQLVPLPLHDAPPLTEWLSAIGHAVQAEDRKAWSDWARRANEAGHLSTEVAKKIQEKVETYPNFEGGVTTSTSFPRG